MTEKTHSELQKITLQGGVAFIFRSAGGKKLIEMVQRIASSPAAVLIEGETGTGKELIARSIHHFSLRCHKPLVDVNCGALPDHLAESELFGYEKGAFSGADTPKPGLFELADGGTLFLDEVGELDPKMQVKLLRVLDGTPYYRLGGTRKVSVNVRIIAATNRDLKTAVENGTFRKDLYHRLCQVQILVPPLRERPEDIVALAESFLEQVRPGAKFGDEALQALSAYPWPGNVRELKNVIIRSVVVLDPAKKLIQPDDLPTELKQTGPGASEPVAVGELDSLERLTIERILNSCNGDQAMAAEQLGISRRTLSRKLKRYQVEIDPESVPLGALDDHQQRYFRSSLDRNISIRSSIGYETSARLINLSRGGVGLQQVSQPLKLTGILDLTFRFSDDASEVSAKGKISWADDQGNVGIRFVSIPPQSQQQIHAWLSAKMEAEGWSSPGRTRNNARAMATSVD